MRVLPLIFSVVGFLGVIYFKEITNSPLYWAKAEAGREEAACWGKVHQRQETQQRTANTSSPLTFRPLHWNLDVDISDNKHIHTYTLLHVTKVHMNLVIRLRMHLMHPLKSRQSRQIQGWWQKYLLFITVSCSIKCIHLIWHCAPIQNVL